ncbi:YaiI/YqxD family protein [Staphylococcus auricularis]|uniref:UPF0178 protein BU607_05355 n=1 Tax=Staphylococcus auricularis TaxID=29379 RepID=A0ABX5IG16_9STAP|nr:YaiI/YqxD family protein [Staphylococcus auricularis]MCE5039461.1 YaiI/YqxD family protein [Staphylococcus auricularis]MEB6570011.1 YaiI/YqxD family protein [Staphylococcus auricularis]PTH18365.1 YaiI/YqxD family protein [Staphylococcus auricularis]PTH27280.1 YaiI/YqxD family protein [Staphylococcus auricularis]
MTRVIIDGDACPVTQSVIELTEGTGIFTVIVRSYSHYSSADQPEHVTTIYVDQGPDAVDYKIVQLCESSDIVITQDYGLASLLINRATAVLHHSGKIYNMSNIDQLLNQRYLGAKHRRSGGRTKGPRPFTEQDRKLFEERFSEIIKPYRTV